MGTGAAGRWRVGGVGERAESYGACVILQLEGSNSTFVWSQDKVVCRADVE